MREDADHHHHVRALTVALGHCFQVVPARHEPSHQLPGLDLLWWLLGADVWSTARHLLMNRWRIPQHCFPCGVLLHNICIFFTNNDSCIICPWCRRGLKSVCTTSYELWNVVFPAHRDTFISLWGFFYCFVLNVNCTYVLI